MNSMDGKLNVQFSYLELINKDVAEREKEWESQIHLKRIFQIFSCSKWVGNNKETKRMKKGRLKWLNIKI